MKENITCSELDSTKMDNGNSSLGCIFHVTHSCVAIYDTAALVKDQRKLDIRKYWFILKKNNECKKLSTDCVTASSVNMFKNKVDIYQEGGLHID